MLTDLAVRKAKPAAKEYRIFDTGGVSGLALRVPPSGVKSWQLRYRDESGKENTASLGKLEHVSLAEARAKAKELKPLLRAGETMRQIVVREQIKRQGEAASTFAAARAAWLPREARRQGWSEGHRAKVAQLIEANLSKLDPMPLSKISAAIVSPLLHPVEERAPTVYDKLRRYVRNILDDAVEAGILAGNPLPAHRRRARPGAVRHYPAVTSLEGIGEILRAARDTEACEGVRRAHELLAFTVQRVGEVTPARWEQFDLEVGVWTIPREQMKASKAIERGPHLVPLPPALLASLRAWKEADGPREQLVCRAPRDPRSPITPEAVEKHYRERLGLRGRHKPHSWRSALKTLASDAGKPRDVVEAQLDHVIGDKTESAYDRAKRLELRRDLMAWYEQQLTTARDGAKVLPMKRGGARGGR